MRPRFRVLTLMLAVAITAMLLRVGIWWRDRAGYIERSNLHSVIAIAIRRGQKGISNHLPVRSITVGPSTRGYFSLRTINKLGEKGLDPVKAKALCDEYALSFERVSAAYLRAATYPWESPPAPEPLTRRYIYEP